MAHVIQCFLDYSFTFIVQGRCGHIQQEDLGVSDERTSYGNTLLLPSAHLASTFTHHSFKFLEYKSKITAHDCKTAVTSAIVLYIIFKCTCGSSIIKL